MFLQFGINNDENNMMARKMALINEQTSPLQRIMWVYNVNEPARRTFENNIGTFHIGNGYFLSVAHNLRIPQGYFRSINDEIYRQEILPKLDGAQNRLMEQYCSVDDYTGKRYLNTTDPNALQSISNILKQKRFDTRWVTLADKKICDTFLVFLFKNNSFYNDETATQLFEPEHRFYDGDGRRHTFLVQVELVEAFYGADIALYRTVNAPQEIINQIPSVDVNFDFLDESADKMYCLQSSPAAPTGRLLNQARIEGLLDHFNIFADEIGGNYLHEGYRYLIKGYFRFGSSGAPYLYYNSTLDKFVANAVQSEASGIQLSIKNDKEGNFQYVNAIASPLYIIKEQLERHTNAAV